MALFASTTEMRCSTLTVQAAPQTVSTRPPRVGELVLVRSRRWLVDEVIEAKSPGQTCITRLSCADDDAQGQSLEVLWDYELDRLILEEEGWADLAAKGFDQPRQFAAFLHTLRCNCVTATDPNLFQAPFRAGIKIDAYQMEPLRKALRLPRVNLFIADDTGLGKTIEAGLIARELLLRKKAKTIVVATPPSVLEQWKAELEKRFGLVFEFLDRAYLTRMRRERGFGVNPWRTWCSRRSQSIPVRALRGRISKTGSGMSFIASTGTRMPVFECRSTTSRAYHPVMPSGRTWRSG
jgi:hypothetical protein